MKKFLTLLTVFMLALSLAVPAGATDYSFSGVILNDDVYESGEYIGSVNNVISAFNASNAVMLYYPTSGAARINIYSTDVYYDTKDGVSGLWGYEGGGYVTLDYELTSNYWVVTGESGYSADNMALNFISTNSIKWSAYDIYKADGTIFFDGDSGFVREYCDGSACPANDVNIDGFCDDCGMTLMSLSRSPVAPDVNGSNKNYVMFYSGTVYKYTVYTSDESYTIRGEEYGARYRTYIDPSVTAQRYESYDGINWEQTYNGKTANDYPGEVGYELISSTFDWYTDDGDRFFPVPLWEEVQTVTQGEMGELTVETVGTMKVLVACGVGLMALLAVLSLFGKRSLIFLR